jgi:hypothetical protein
MIFYECIHSYGDRKAITEMGKDMKESCFLSRTTYAVH